jgi:Arc/MetJ family transcription regulator
MALSCPSAAPPGWYRQKEILDEITEVDHMARTVNNIDRKALREVKEILGTTSDADAINEALRRVVRGRRFDDFLKLLDKTDLGKDPELWDRAWRRTHSSS